MSERLPFLPEEVLAIVFRKLDCRQVLVCSSVRKIWHQAAKSEEVWREVSCRELGGTLERLPDGTSTVDSLRLAYQAPPASLDRALLSHNQNQARLASLVKAITGWEATFSRLETRRSATLNSSSITKLPLGVWLMFPFTELEQSVGGLSSLVLQIFAKHPRGQDIVANVPHVKTVLTETPAFDLYQQSHLFGVSTLLTTEQLPYLNFPPGTPIMQAYLHSEQLFDLISHPIPQALPVLSREKGSPPPAWPQPGELAFSVVVDFNHLNGAPVGAFCAQLFVEDFQGDALVARAANTGDVRLLGKSSRLEDREEAEGLDLKQKVQQITDWAESDAVAEVALYDKHGCLCLGRTCVEVWTHTIPSVSEKQRHNLQGTVWKLLFIPDPDQEHLDEHQFFSNGLAVTVEPLPMISLNFDPAAAQRIYSR